MALKNLQSHLEKRKVIDPNHSSKLQPYVEHIISVDAEIACNIIDILFDQINRCMQQERSRIKINMFTKGIIGRMLGDNTRSGIKDYVANMYDRDIKELLSDIQIELDKAEIDNVKVDKAAIDKIK